MTTRTNAVNDGAEFLPIIEQMKRAAEAAFARAVADPIGPFWPTSAQKFQQTDASRPLRATPSQLL
jgi:hypothetical protein